MKTAALISKDEIEARRVQMSGTLRQFAELGRSYRRPPVLTLSQWSDRYRVLSSESSGEPGRWVTDKYPFECEIMDAISDPKVSEVVVMKASQLGITDCAIVNAIGYFADQDPCPMLVVQPTLEIAEAFSTDRLAPMIRDSPRVRRLFAEARSRDAQNTLRRKSFFGGFVAMGGANSGASLSGRPVRIVFFDDCDRYPSSAGTEGDPISLGRARTSGFWNRKTIIISSPKLAGASRIQKAFDTSTQEFWHLPCPNCEELQILSWDRVDFRTVRHRCAYCNHAYPRWAWLSRKGVWRATRQRDEHGEPIKIRGFHLNGLVNPQVEWEILIGEFLEATRAAKEGDFELLQTFRNTRLGVVHQPDVQRIDIDLYAERREVYPTEEDVPPGPVVLTAGVDVGERQLNFEVVGWARGRESWGIEYGWIEGDPRETEVWKLLDEVLTERIFVCHDGAKMRVRRICVDSNYASDYVHSYTRGREPRVVSVRGMGGIGKAFIKGVGARSKTVRAVVYTLGVDSGKEEVVNRLKVETIGPGFCHFPKRSDGEPVRGYDDEYFKGLCAEQRVMRSKHGFRTYVWEKQISQRNEPFDCRVYALAALMLPYSGIRLESMERDLLPKASDQPKAPSAGAPSFGVQNPQGVAGPAAATEKSQWGTQNRPLEW